MTINQIGNNIKLINQTSFFADDIQFVMNKINSNAFESLFNLMKHYQICICLQYNATILCQYVETQ